MPLPALIGLPALVAFISSAIVSVFTFIVERLTWRLGVYLVIVGLILSNVTILYNQFQNFVSSLALSAPPELLQAAFFFPSNTGTCINIILTAELAAALYSMTNNLLRTKIDVVK